MPSRIVCPLLLGLLVTLSGCGHGTDVKVSGKLLKGGTPYKVPEGQQALMTFVAVEPADKSNISIQADDPYSASFDPDGTSFTVPGKEGYGIPPGKYRVALTQRWIREALEKQSFPPAKKLIEREKDQLGDRFGLKSSPILVEIKESKELTIDLDKPTG
jgi:hypothetical protein